MSYAPSPPLEVMVRAMENGLVTRDGRATEKALERAEIIARKASKGLSPGGEEYIMREVIKFVTKKPAAGRGAVDFAADRARAQWRQAVACMEVEQSAMDAQTKETNYNAYSINPTR